MSDDSRCIVRGLGCLGLLLLSRLGRVEDLVGGGWSDSTTEILFLLCLLLLLVNSAVSLRYLVNWNRSHSFFLGNYASLLSEYSQSKIELTGESLNLLLLLNLLLNSGILSINLLLLEWLEAAFGWCGQSTRDTEQCQCELKANLRNQKDERVEDHKDIGLPSW